MSGSAIGIFARTHGNLIFLARRAKPMPSQRAIGGAFGVAHFFARSREHLTRGHHPAGACRPVVVQRATQVGNPLAADLAAVAPITSAVLISPYPVF